MRNGISHTILALAIISSIFIYLPGAKGGCGGGCSISGGGGISSASFMGDRAVDIGMSSFDEFVRDKLGSNPVAALQAKSASQDDQLSTNSSLNQTVNGNSSRNSSAFMLLSNDMAETNSDNRTIKLGSIGVKDSGLSSPDFANFNNNWL